MGHLGACCWECDYQMLGRSRATEIKGNGKCWELAVS